MLSQFRDLCQHAAAVAVEPRKMKPTGDACGWTTTILAWSLVRTTRATSPTKALLRDVTRNLLGWLQWGSEVNSTLRGVPY